MLAQAASLPALPSLGPRLSSFFFPSSFFPASSTFEPFSMLSPPVVFGARSGCSSESLCPSGAFCLTSGSRSVSGPHGSIEKVLHKSAQEASRQRHPGAARPFDLVPGGFFHRGDGDFSDCERKPRRICLCGTSICVKLKCVSQMVDNKLVSSGGGGSRTIQRVDNT